MHETNKDKSFEVDQLHSVALKRLCCTNLAYKVYSVL